MIIFGHIFPVAHPARTSYDADMQSTLIKTLSLIILIAALGAGCGKKENTEAETPGAANPPMM